MESAPWRWVAREPVCPHLDKESPRVKIQRPDWPERSLADERRCPRGYVSGRGLQALREDPSAKPRGLLRGEQTEREAPDRLVGDLDPSQQEGVDGTAIHAVDRGDRGDVASDACRSGHLFADITRLAERIGEEGDGASEARLEYPA